MPRTSGPGAALDPVAAVRSWHRRQGGDRAGGGDTGQARARPRAARDRWPSPAGTSSGPADRHGGPEHGQSLAGKAHVDARQLDQAACRAGPRPSPAPPPGRSRRRRTPCGPTPPRTPSADPLPPWRRPSARSTRDDVPGRRQPEDQAGQRATMPSANAEAGRSTVTSSRRGRSGGRQCQQRRHAPARDHRAADAGDDRQHQRSRSAAGAPAGRARRRPRRARRSRGRGPRRAPAAGWRRWRRRSAARSRRRRAARTASAVSRRRSRPGAA